MNDNNKLPVDVLDSGWLKFWIGFSCVCLLLSIFLPDVHMLKNRYVLTWFWDKNVVNSPGYMGVLSIYLLIGFSVILLVCRSLFEGKYLAVISVGLLTLAAFLLMSISLKPVQAGIWSRVLLATLILTIFAAGIILAGTHLQKVLSKRTFPRFLLLTGGVLLLIALFIPATAASSRSFMLGLFSLSAWSGQSLYASLSIIVLFSIAIMAIASIRFDTRRVLSIFMRLVFLSIPVLIFFYFYSSITESDSIATICFEAAQQMFWVYAFLMVPASVASLIEWNTRPE